MSEEELDRLLDGVSHLEIDAEKGEVILYYEATKHVCNLDALTQEEVDRIIHSGT